MLFVTSTIRQPEVRGQISPRIKCSSLRFKSSATAISLWAFAGANRVIARTEREKLAAALDIFTQLNCRWNVTQCGWNWKTWHKEHELPCRHNLERYLDEYIAAAGIAADPEGSLFRTTDRKTGKQQEMWQQEAYRVIQ